MAHFFAVINFAEILNILIPGIYIIYCIVMLHAWYGWISIRENNPQHAETTIRISIVIAARNEKKNLPLLLTDIAKQIYPSDFIEVIIVDDHSDEKISSSSLKKKNGKIHLQIIDLPDDKMGKKQAIIEGVKQSTGELLLLTDADCRMPPHWINCYATKFHEERPGVMIGLIDYPDQKGMFHTFARFDLISLVISGAGLANLGYPVMCNGANMAVRRNLYTSLGSQIKPNISSGDDIFLLHAVKKLKNEKISLVTSHNAIVTTRPPSGLKDFISQRLRWTSKSKNYTDTSSILLALLIFMANLSLLVILINSIVNNRWLYAALIFVFKTSIDGFILTAGLNYFGGLRKIIWLPVFELIYLFYSVFLAFGGFFINSSWKGRKIAHEINVQ
jgi:poly-beta-1,6-N-acetyl-D-glucosamine synthase